MAKHGRDKKRRAGRTGRTQLKHRSYAKYKPPQFCDMSVKSNWDATKSAKINMANIGLSTNINVSGPGTTGNDEGKSSRHGSDGNDIVIKVFNIPDSDTLHIPKKTKSQIMLPLSVSDQKYVVRLVCKYGTNYKAMERDIKINNMQLTQTKLSKLCSRFLLLSTAQIVVDVPDHVKILLSQVN